MSSTHHHSSSRHHHHHKHKQSSLKKESITFDANIGLPSPVAIVHKGSSAKKVRKHKTKKSSVRKIESFITTYLFLALGVIFIIGSIWWLYDSSTTQGGSLWNNLMAFLFPTNNVIVEHTEVNGSFDWNIYIPFTFGFGLVGISAYIKNVKTKLCAALANIAIFYLNIINIKILYYDGLYTMNSCYPNHNTALFISLFLLFTSFAFSFYLNTSKIKKSIDNIKSKQYFSKVDYKLEDSIDKKNTKDFNLFVKEQATGNISAGVGYGTNGGSFQAAIDERNFLGQGINLNFTGTIATTGVLGEFTYVNPNFRDSDRELSASLIAKTDTFKNSGFDNKTYGTKVGTKYEIYEDLYFRPNANIQSDKSTVNNGATVSALLASRAGSYLTTGVGYNFSIDRRDSKFNPTNGWSSYFDQNIATLISDVPTITTSIGSTIYKELFNTQYIGSARIRIANSSSLDNAKDIKLSDRLFASVNDLRGFELRGVGPIDGSDHVGGNNLATVSLKSTFPNPIPESLRANTYLFLDAGNVWGVDYSDAISGSSKIRSSTGLALDIMSPLGPLSFTYAIPLSKASTDISQRFLFNIGSSF